MFQMFPANKLSLKGSIPKNEDEETNTYSVYAQEAVIIFLREYEEFKSVHKDVKEFSSVAKFSDKNKTIRPIVLQNKKFSPENPNFNNFITLKIICIAIKQIFKKQRNCRRVCRS